MYNRSAVKRRVACLIVFGVSIAVLTAVPSLAQWQRTVFSGKGTFNDTPIPHPLSYFTTDPFMRDDGGDFCETCKPPDREKYSITSDVHRLGELSSFPIIEILYTIHESGDDRPAPPAWKFILVQTGTDSYREIYHLQASGPATLSANTTEIVKLPEESVLSTNDPDGGNGGGCWEGYWWFDSSGPHQIDFSVLDNAIEKHIPPSSWFTSGCWALNMGQEEITSVVQKKNPQCRACDILGNVTAYFHLHGAIAEPDEITFYPY